MSTAPHAKIDLSRPRYDQSTFLGRLRHFLNVTDMRTLLTPQSRINEATQILKDYEEKNIIPQGGEEELWQAQKIKDTCLHPDTGQVIPAPVRISAYVPANVIIAGGMLLPGAGLANQVFWQWVNQSYNVALNHANRNASNPVSSSELALTYFAAVSTSVGVAVGLMRGAQRLPLSPRAQKLLLLQVPFISVALSNLVNVFLVRRNEITSGIQVMTNEGHQLGLSQTAGWRAAAMTATVRVASSLPLMTAVPLITSSLSSLPLFTSKPWLLKGPVNLLLVGLALQLGLPVASALFPQKVPILASKLEGKFQNVLNEKGEPHKVLYYNRGL